MLSLPLTINEVTLNVTINFKDITIKKNELNIDTNEQKYSDIIIDKIHFNNYFNKNKIINDPKIITNFIRNNCNYNENEKVKITTRKYKNSEFYDTYFIPLPNINKNDVNDYIYGLLVNSIRMSDPDKINKEKLDFKKTNFDLLFTGDFFNIVKKIQSESSNPLYIRNKLRESGYNKQLEILDFFNNLSYEVDDAVLTEDLNSIINFLESNKKEHKVLKTFLTTSIDNNYSYMSLAAFNKLVYNKSLNWPVLSSTQQKILIKKFDSKRIV